MNGLLWLLVLLGLAGQAPAGDATAELKARLEFMKKSMARHEIQCA